ncbi:molybdopterin molybdotransferase MoeA [Thiovibrio frasassiensis]|uniref:Molybdopterin molybdenumtransferase n=1 Tax=Thiovibrio frasassiensis TaxID=2984131 RepID=A0A9X4MG25_9BACT|nr:molybdopterin molybdotransferase MoeA [Thiovibrio frasassiensis]MDG4475743.1 molybdopterin molybdotransferase MoeA [Thiovibrio frasassiensis]
MPILSLKDAQQLIVSQCSALSTETVSLPEACDRIAGQAIKAIHAVPAFARSAMDGYAVNSRDLTGGAEPVSLKITGEIAAGTTDLPRLTRKSAIAIMTGGALPPGANQVVPFERCERKGSLVLVHSPPRPGAFIRARGTDLAAKQTIVRAGAKIEPQHLPLLAESGLAQVSVVARPELAIICTGSELLDTLDTPETGQIIGGNRFLLAALLRAGGATSRDFGLVADDCDRIVALLREALDGPSQGVITTGGMGPGNYDLLPQAFATLGIRPLYTALAVRPGRSTMFGLYRGKPIFALPGPPPAVFLLFHELVLPALRTMQRQHRPLPPLVRATLATPILLKKTGILNLKGAVASLSGKHLSVRPCRKNEAANAIIHLPPNRKHLLSGEDVSLRFCNPAFL